ncbi:hypothetical protein BCV72DRAFT_235152 [Rhizopus microsporus var. microsporus]|uniref:Uncharacterized protein n=2 Tax=Rhizopus microsporus TaxID=58291 RepID=A0A2G4SXM7_RHIZD|nr:uncharacterized protein RHIMIDRAFT_279504 [Rhizopus microsporus ATCC 52813]ORE02174.1 hypothetical protein BCV72DRAFT_235152 [Rhizopus microsporus var. microsporus]PHZ13502.1 hypothetical protein RHIMIDRAFT_279504 [Rhizopus microsporus ATCC 52813]
MAFKRKLDDHSTDMTNNDKKQRKLCVTFNSEITLLETYSSEEYDRSGIFSSPILYKLNPSRLPQLSLTISQCPALTSDDDEASSAETSPIPSPPLCLKKNKKKPLLSIDTSICSDPLFFSQLTTNYKTDSTENEFLVPLSIA